MNAESSQPSSLWALGGLLVASFIAVHPAQSQSVEGWVVDDDSGAPMTSTEVVVLSPDGSVLETYVTDDTGRFIVTLPESGSYRLRASRLGYSPSTSEAFTLAGGQAAMAELRLQLDPVMLDPLYAIVAGESIALQRAGFYERVEMGFGEMRTADYFAEKPPLDISDLFQGRCARPTTSPRSRPSISRICSRA